MARLLSIVAVIAAMFLVGGVAEAAPGTYDVKKQWIMTNGEDGARIIPPMQDDYVEVLCKNKDQVKDYKINDPALVYAPGIRPDRTGVFANPEFNAVGDGEAKVLEITVTCQQA